MIFIFQDESVYGRLTFDSGISIPKEEELDKFTEREHGLKSDKVIIKDAKTLFIPNFHYDGTAPTAYFYVGSGQGVEARKNPKTKVNFLKEGCVNFVSPVCQKTTIKIDFWQQSTLNGKIQWRKCNHHTSW